MQNEDLSPEMSVDVEYEGSVRPAKVIGPVEERKTSTDEVIRIIGWKVAIEPSNLHVTVTADKIHPPRMKSYRVYRTCRSEKSVDREFRDVPATSQGHAVKVAMTVLSWTTSEIECAEERPDIVWTGLLWYVLDPDGHLIEGKDKSLMEFALEDEARQCASGLPGEGYKIQQISAFRVQNERWPRKKLDA